jgi:hypothetical protein
MVRWVNNEFVHVLFKTIGYDFRIKMMRFEEDGIPVKIKVSERPFGLERSHVDS